MEFVIGALTSLTIAYVVSRVAVRQDTRLRFDFPKYRQSYNYQLLSHIMISTGSHMTILEKMKTQATDYFDNKYSRLVIMDEHAYWISGQKLWCAPITEEGIDETYKKEVDTMGMDKVELNKMITVVDKLTEGKQNDGGSPGNKNV